MKKNNILFKERMKRNKFVFSNICFLLERKDGLFYISTRGSLSLISSYHSADSPSALSVQKPRELRRSEAGWLITTPTTCVHSRVVSVSTTMRSRDDDDDDVDDDDDDDDASVFPHGVLWARIFTKGIPDASYEYYEKCDDKVTPAGAEDAYASALAYLHVYTCTTRVSRRCTNPRLGISSPLWRLWKSPLIKF